MMIRRKIPLCDTNSPCRERSGLVKKLNDPFAITMQCCDMPNPLRTVIDFSSSFSFLFFFFWRGGGRIKKKLVEKTHIQLHHWGKSWS
jgi:hypothetical protein